MADNTVPYVITRGLGNLAGLAGLKFLSTRGFLLSAAVMDTITPLVGSATLASTATGQSHDVRLMPTTA